HNESKYDLKLIQAKNQQGDFMTNPPDALPAGKSAGFVYVQTPHEKDPKKRGCKGFLVYDVGSPSVTQWTCTWENPAGEKNIATSNPDPQVPGLSHVEHADQGDENVPFDFTLSSEDTGGGQFEYSVGPFKVGDSEKLKGGSLDKRCNE